MHSTGGELPWIPRAPRKWDRSPAPAGADVYSFQVPSGKGGPEASLDINAAGNEYHVGFDPSLAIYDARRDLIATSNNIAFGDEPSLGQSVSFGRGG